MPTQKYLLQLSKLLQKAVSGLVVACSIPIVIQLYVKVSAAKVFLVHPTEENPY